MSLLFEKPLLLGLLGAITAVVLGFLWYQTGRKPLLYGLGLVLVLTAAGMMTASWVITEREAVEGALRAAARAVERNDMEEVMKSIHSQAPHIRSQVQAEFPRYEFHEIKIKSNLEITFDNPRHPTEATAKFNVVVSGSERDGLIKNRRVPRYVIVTFRKEGNDWRVYSYQHDDAGEGLLQR